uniref:Alpha-galactosidase n=1 Tax=Heliothis virescens TaxID=7102 RepID=A0A2A4JKI6_HELVI
MNDIEFVIVMLIPVLILLVCELLSSGQGLDNGLALTPPMGWLSWLRFECNIDCKKSPNECISENLIKRTADAMVSEGYLEAGYQYVTIDDCWPEKSRDVDGRLVADKARFPNGIKGLSRYVHSKGLKFGIYEDYGNYTCAGYPGVMGHELVDVASFAVWEVDYVKLDGCYAENMDTGYPLFGKLLNYTHRPILYSCSWPAYQDFPNYTAIAETCNIWRNYGDIQNSWSSVVNIMKWFGDNQDIFAHVAGPGNFNDPDMLVIGNSGLTVDQARVQMAVWSVLAAPLIMSVDLSSIKPEFKEILLNKDVIDVNQDPLGKQGLRVYTGDDNQIWNRELSNNSRALAFVNLQTTVAEVLYTHEQMKLPTQDYIVKDLYGEEKDRHLRSGEDFKVKINATGVKFYKFIPKVAEFDPISENEIK